MSQIETKLNVLNVECPRCKAPPLRACDSVGQDSYSRGAPLRRAHTERHEAARSTSAVSPLAAATAFVVEHYPLPRCRHGSALRDHGGDVLEPPCGCVLALRDPKQVKP